MRMWSFSLESAAHAAQPKALLFQKCSLFPLPCWYSSFPFRNCEALGDFTNTASKWSVFKTKQWTNWFLFFFFLRVAGDYMLLLLRWKYFDGAVENMALQIVFLVGLQLKQKSKKCGWQEKCRRRLDFTENKNGPVMAGNASNLCTGCPTALGVCSERFCRKKQYLQLWRLKSTGLGNSLCEVCASISAA